MHRSFRFALLSVVLLVLGVLIGPAGAQEAPSIPQAGPCAPGAVYDPACDVDHDGDVDIFDVQLAAGHWNQTGVWTGGDYWALGGNAGTTPGTHFLGTTDNQPLEVRVNGSRALLIQRNDGQSPNLIGGFVGNSVSPGQGGATIGGGGVPDQINSVTDDYGTVGGGLANSVTGRYGTVGGGQGNTASELSATVGGGESNTASEWMATVGGGQGNTASGFVATVGGGSSNTASGRYATVPGGMQAVAPHYGELAYASGGFAAAGDAQTSLYVLRRETGDETLTELYLNEVYDRITLATDRVMTFDILVVASHRFGGGSSAGYQVAGVIRNIGGATAFVGTPLKTVLGENVAGWDVQLEASDALDALLVKVQGSSGTTIRWVASVRTVEVGR